MPSEWAIKAAEKLLYDGCGEIAHTGDGRDVLADALDAARIEGLKEAAKIAKSCVSGYGAAHYIRARIEEIKG